MTNVAKKEVDNRLKHYWEVEKEESAKEGDESRDIRKAKLDGLTL